MKPRTLLILLAVVVALGLFIRFYEHDLPSTEERAANEKKPFVFQKDEVTAVTLEGEGPTVRLERITPPPAAGKGRSAATRGPAGGANAGAAQAEWRLVRPIAARADGAAVDRLLDDLSFLEKTRTIEHPDLAALGLAKPRAKVLLATTRGEKTLEIGGEVPVGSETVARVAGEPTAFVVGDSVLNDFHHKLDDWRDRQVLKLDRDRIERIALEPQAGPRILLAKRGDSFWIESPLADRADREQIEKLLTDLTGLSAESFLDNKAPRPPAGLGLEPPRVTIEAFLTGERNPVRVDLGASHPAPAAPAAPPPPDAPGEPPPPPAGGNLTYARAAGQLFETRSPLPDEAVRPVQSWRSLTLSGFEVHQIDSARIIAPPAGTPAPVAPAASKAGAAPTTAASQPAAVAPATAAAPASTGRDTFQLTRSGADWKRGAETISYLPVSDLLFALTEAKADRLLSPQEAQSSGLLAPGAPPALTLDLRGQGASEVITLYPPLGNSKGVPARVSGRDAVLILPADKLKDIQDKLTAVRDAKPVSPPSLSKSTPKPAPAPKGR